MIRWTPSRIAEALGARTLLDLPSEPVAGVATDTREEMTGAAFIALRGERFDAHRFLAGAIDRGARVLIIDDEAALTPDLRESCIGHRVGVLLVDHTTHALARLASAYRGALRGAVVAVTGSNGKTTTVRMIDAALGAALRGSASRKSFNNSVGVPLTLLAAAEDDRYLVAEVGMNAPGEIAPLASITRPDIVVITNIGHAHIEAMGSKEAIAREKAALLDGLAPGGVAVLSAESPELRALVDTPDARWFGGDDAAGRIEGVESGETTRFTLSDGSSWSVPMPGAHNALNATAAILVGREFGLDDATIARGLASMTPPEMRFERVEAGGVRFYNDAYNASPESVDAALCTFAALTRHGAGRRVVVLGDMLEQGDHAPAAHARALEQAAAIGPDLLMTFGPAYGACAHPGTAFARADEDAMREGGALIEAGDLVLLKGSRGVGLERLIPIVRSQHAGAP